MILLWNKPINSWRKSYSTNVVKNETDESLPIRNYHYSETTVTTFKTGIKSKCDNKIVKRFLLNNVCFKTSLIYISDLNKPKHCQVTINHRGVLLSIIKLSSPLHNMPLYEKLQHINRLDGTGSKISLKICPTLIHKQYTKAY